MTPLSSLLVLTLALATAAAPVQPAKKPTADGYWGSLWKREARMHSDGLAGSVWKRDELTTPLPNGLPPTSWKREGKHPSTDGWYPPGW